jgi:hypothetical protein
MNLFRPTYATLSSDLDDFSLRATNQATPDRRCIEVDITAVCQFFHAPMIFIDSPFGIRPSQLEGSRKNQNTRD